MVGVQVVGQACVGDDFAGIGGAGRELPASAVEGVDVPFVVDDPRPQNDGQCVGWFKHRRSETDLLTRLDIER
ncbi:hypothetical protein D3C81_805800 [compost metagenome]